MIGLQDAMYFKIFNGDIHFAASVSDPTITFAKQGAK
jgi:hypothetical protein